jgi:hypothetical protein
LPLIAISPVRRHRRYEPLTVTSIGIRELSAMGTYN